MTGFLVLFIIVSVSIFALVSTHQKINRPDFDHKTLHPFFGAFIVLLGLASDIFILTTLEIPNSGFFIVFAILITIISLSGIYLLTRKIKH